MNSGYLHSVSSIISHPLLEEYPALWASTQPPLRRLIMARDHHIFMHGDTASSLWLVISGWVKLIRQTPDGKESVVGLCTDGDMFGEAALFAHANYPYTAQVIGNDTELVAMPSATIRDMIAKDPSLSARIMALLNERTGQAQLKLEQQSTMSAAQRLGCFLIRLCQTQASGERLLRIPVEKHILASYLGMKPETLSRSQHQLKSVHVTVDGHEVMVNDIEKLRQFVCNSCSQSGSCDAEEALG